MPKYAADIDGVRWYRHPEKFDGGYVYRSVTNVTGSLPKPQLLRWYANVTAQAAVEQHEAWSNMPAHEALDWLKNTPYRNRNRAAARGTTIHAVIENMLSGHDYDIEASAIPWVASVKRFMEEALPKPELLEATVYNDKVLTAGTFDFLGRLDRAPELGRCLIDWKTSKGVYPDMAVQVVGGYALGSEYILTDDGREIPWRPPDTVLIVHFTQDGYTIRPVPIDRIYRRAFLACLEIRKWETDAPKIDGPYQLRMDLDGPQFADMPKDVDLQSVRTRLKALTTEQQLTLSQHAVELNITTKLKQMTTDDLERLNALITIYELEHPTDQVEDDRDEVVKEEAWRRIRRPMP